MSTEVVSAVVAQASDIKEGELREVELGEGKVLLVKKDGEIHAIGNKCSHYGAPMKKGAIANGRIRCPWHGACFSLKTGDIEDYPGVDGIHVYKVDIEGNDVRVTAPKQSFTQWKKTPKFCKAHQDDKRIFAIVGAGPAGEMCAETLRKEGYTGRIVVFGKEKHLPYDRPKLSKALSVQVDKILLRPESFYQENNIEVRLGEEVVSLDAATKTITTDRGDTIQYDQCFVATGGSPRTVPAPGADLANIFLLRDPEHASGIAAVADGKRIVVVGSSFIGMEVASLVVKKAKSVIVVGMESVPFERVMGPQIGLSLQRWHENNGICFRMKRVVKEFWGVDGAVSGVLLDSGEVLDAELVIVGAGVIPTTKFVKGVTLERDQSIVCDATLKCGDGLYAGGDIARYPFHYHPHSVRVEHWGMATFHGRTAALNMMGQKVEVKSIPFFWTTQYGKSIRYAGHALQFDDMIVDGDLKALNFLAIFVHNNKVLAAASMDAARDPVVAAIAELMTFGVMPSADEIRKSTPDFIALAAKIPRQEA
eukprot:TRINITY_DN858_c0_g1_i1.p1 TRINITY_DN858_c0_g1~~TRINITY_DN858_c0_g1_i1.p1  ORF type:complete len:536 (-),score=170.22 TRINITY_DN858_c0_g1_i1:40-1647(-)